MIFQCSSIGSTVGNVMSRCCVMAVSAILCTCSLSQANAGSLYLQFESPHGNSYVVDHGNWLQHRGRQHFTDTYARRGHYYEPHRRHYNRWQHKLTPRAWRHPRPFHHYYADVYTSLAGGLLTVPWLYEAYDFTSQPEFSDSTNIPVTPTQTTTAMYTTAGLSSLPDNARVIQQDGHTYYQWQGKTYRYDWEQQAYQIVELDN